MIDYYEMIEMIKRGEEFIITCFGKRYWISQTKEYIIFTSVEDRESQYFSSLDEFLSDAKINGHFLSNLKSEIK
ncbi:hypothetical protein [Streptococcus ruminantium]|uniref:hypothetical protein n=1 Tax=Streptococcus ruminantium TaxID=1917441 RepID=UPI0012DC678F|nr:hypothetical protein [Streptococcus ruminantium]MDQ8767692.1 hypothetical protein [Streptococcus ruminantium]MDQ8780771.1 hypothetical protein [Streptococcus ruminantium]BDD40596.1 hypothetical protein GUT184_08600 [Streptococcus ruminantium]